MAWRKLLRLPARSVDSTIETRSESTAGENMAILKRLVLDVLKPRHPNIIDFATAIAELGPDYRVVVKVDEVDDKTESVMLSVEGKSLDFEAIQKGIQALGGSLHSIDEIEAVASMTVEDEGPGEKPA